MRYIFASLTNSGHFFKRVQKNTRCILTHARTHTSTNTHHKPTTAIIIQHSFFLYLFQRPHKFISFSFSIREPFEWFGEFVFFGSFDREKRKNLTDSHFSTRTASSSPQHNFWQNWNFITAHLVFDTAGTYSFQSKNAIAICHRRENWIEYLKNLNAKCILDTDTQTHVHTRVQYNFEWTKNNGH